MLHTHEVTGSSPVVSTRNEKHHPKGWCFSFLPEQGTRTHLNARCQWHLAATSSQTGGNHTLCPAAKRPSSPVVSPGGIHPKGWCFSFLVEQGTRTHLNARCRWHLAATSSQTGGNHTLCPLAKRPSSPVVPPEASTPKGGVFISGGARSRTKMTGRWYPACHFLYQNRSDNRISATCHGTATSCRNQLRHSGYQRFSINCWFCALWPGYCSKNLMLFLTPCRARYCRKGPWQTGSLLHCHPANTPDSAVACCSGARRPLSTGQEGP